MNKFIDGKTYAKMLHGGASLLSSRAQEINDLNVFPVPDGDTGTNMVKTLEGGLSEITETDISSIGTLSKSFSHGVLLGARGNSGVILSQIFAGIGEELSKHDVVDAIILAKAYRCGIRKSYSAVQNPTEGTILTVFREATEYASDNITENSTIEDFFELHINKARESLAKTKELLPVLQEADVVDSGGAGYLYIALGMYEVLTGKMHDVIMQIADKPKIDINLFTRDSKLEFGYCTEFLLRLTTNKVDPDSFDIKTILDLLNQEKGDSIVALKEGDIVKVHVHTFNPGNILSRVQAYGEFLTVKIENMSIGHTGEEKKKSKSNKSFFVVTVATGKGICALFEDMGADQIISGGQSMNPSTEDFIEAFDKCDTENIIVLPNNKNIILTAEQAARIYDKAKVHVVPTRNLMQGYGALSVITPGINDIDLLINSAKRAGQSVIGGEITRAVRNVTIDGKTIKQGDYIAISEGSIVASTDTAEKAVLEMLDSVDVDDYEIITLFVGENVDDSKRVELTEYLKGKYACHEIVVYDGGQEVYDYLVAIE